MSCRSKLLLSAGVLVVCVVRLLIQQSGMHTNAITNGSWCTQSLFYMSSCFFLTMWILLRTVALVSYTFKINKKREIWIGSRICKATGTGPQCGSRGRPGSPHQDGCSLSRAAAFPIFLYFWLWCLCHLVGVQEGIVQWKSRLADVFLFVWPSWHFYCLLYHFCPCCPCPKP